MSSRGPLIAVGVFAAFSGIGLAAWLLMAPPPPEAPAPAPVAAPEVPALRPPPAPVTFPEVDDRIGMTTARERRDDLPRVHLKDLPDGKTVHQEAVRAIREQVLQPCVPQRSLREENHTHRLEVDYFVQPTGIVEARFREVTQDRQQVDIAPELLKCFSEKLTNVSGPSVSDGELHHRFVFAYRAP